MIDLADLQGDVLRGYTYPSVSYLFLKIVDFAIEARALEPAELQRRFRDAFA